MTTRQATDDCRGQDSPDTGGSSTEALDFTGLDGILLWLISGKHEPEGGWYRHTRIKKEVIDGFAEERLPELRRMKLIRAIAGLFDYDELACLMRARIASKLLSSESATELERLFKVGEKVSQPLPDRSGAPATGGEAPEGDIDDLDLEAAISEARRLLTELDGAGE